MKTKMKGQPVAIDDIERLSALIRTTSNAVKDAGLRLSIKNSGIQDPLVVIRDGERLILAKGYRRIEQATALGLEKVPCVIRDAPKGCDVERFVKDVRLILDIHRQDLVPSQKCTLILALKEQLGLQNKQLAHYLGVDQDSITNWLAVRKYIPAVVDAMDRGKLTMQNARVFDGLSETGQQFIFKKHRRDLMTSRRGGWHKELRALYPPTSYPAFYVHPDRVAQRLNRSKTSRKGKARTSYRPDEKKRLLASVELKEVEFAELESECDRLLTVCKAAGPVVAAILRTKKLSEHVPEEMRGELERFAESY